MSQQTLSTNSSPITEHSQNNSPKQRISSSARQRISKSCLLKTTKQTKQDQDLILNHKNINGCLESNISPVKSPSAHLHLLMQPPNPIQSQKNHDLFITNHSALLETNQPNKLFQEYIAYMQHQQNVYHIILKYLKLQES